MPRENWTPGRLKPSTPRRGLVAVDPGRGESHDVDRTLAQAADAGELVTSQVRAILGSALSKATETERAARADAERLLTHASLAAEEVVRAMGRLEHELQSHVAAVAESGGAAQDQARSEHSDAMEVLAHVGVQREALEKLVEEARGSQERAPQDASVPSRDAAEPKPGPEKAPEPGSPEVTAQAVERLRTQSDEELAQHFAQAEAAKASGEAPDYWDALQSAIIGEASSRSDFGTQVKPDASLKRKERRQREQALAELRRRAHNDVSAA